MTRMMLVVLTTLLAQSVPADRAADAARIRAEIERICQACVDKDREIIRFPNVLVFMTARPPKGGTKGTSVNHIGFAVPNLRQAVDKVKAAGYPIITRAELPESQPVKDDLAYIENQKTSVAFVMGPDETKVELVENKAATAPAALSKMSTCPNSSSASCNALSRSLRVVASARIPIA